MAVQNKKSDRLPARLHFFFPRFLLCTQPFCYPLHVDAHHGKVAISATSFCTKCFAVKCEHRSPCFICNDLCEIVTRTTIDEDGGHLLLFNRFDLLTQVRGRGFGIGAAGANDGSDDVKAISVGKVAQCFVIGD